jgi:hypothetical protein
MEERHDEETFVLGSEFISGYDVAHGGHYVQMS